MVIRVRYLLLLYIVSYRLTTLCYVGPIIMQLLMHFGRRRVVPIKREAVL